MRVIDSAFQNWRALRIHESSPIPRGASRALRKECRNYTQSHYFPHQPAGTLVGAFRNENLENLSLADESVDILVSQDVLEHVLDPEAAFREIGRVLAPGGAHVFTVPLVRGDSPSVVRARRSSSGTIVHHLPPEYHKNPISRTGSLVATDWGFDIVDTIVASSGLATDIVKTDDPTLGIIGRFSEVVVSKKGPGGSTCATGQSQRSDASGNGV